MSNINEKLQEAIDIKNNIKQALVDKKVDMTDVSFGGYPDKIRSIKGSDSSVYMSYEYPEIMDVVPTDASNAFSKKIDDNYFHNLLEHYTGNAMYGGRRLILGAYNDESKSNDHANHYTLYLYKRLMDSGSGKYGSKCGYTQCKSASDHFFKYNDNSDNAIQQWDYSGFKFKNAGVGDMYGCLNFNSVFPYSPFSLSENSSLKISYVNNKYGMIPWTSSDLNDVNNHYKFATIPAQDVSSFLDNMVFSSFDNNGNRKDSLSSDSSRYMDLSTKNKMPTGMKSYHVWSDLSKYNIQDSNSQFIDTFFNDEIHVYLGGTRDSGDNKDSEDNNKYFQLYYDYDSGTLISQPNHNFITLTPDASFNDMFNSMPDDVSFDITRSFTINTSDNNTWENKEINWKNIIFKKPEIPSKLHVYSFDFGAFQDSSNFKNLIGVSGSSDDSYIYNYSANPSWPDQQSIEINYNNNYKSNYKYLYFDKSLYDQNGKIRDVSSDSSYISDDQWTKIADSSALTPAEFRNGQIYIYKDDLTVNENTILKLADDKGNSYYGCVSISNKNQSMGRPTTNTKSLVSIGYNCPGFNNVSTVICKHGWSMNVDYSSIELYLDGKGICDTFSIDNTSFGCFMDGSTEYYKIEAVDPDNTDTRANLESLSTYTNNNNFTFIRFGMNDYVRFKLKISKRSYDASYNESYTQVWISDTIDMY